MKKQLRRNKLRLNDESQINPDKSIFKSILFWLPYSGALSILLGYGYISGIATTFGYSATDFMHNTSDFLAVALDPLVIIGVRVLSWSALKVFLSSSIYSIDTLGYVIFSLSIYLLYHFFFRTQQKKVISKRWIKNKLSKVFVQDPSKRRFIFQLLLAGLLGFIVKVLATAFVYISTFILFIFILIIPMLGYTIGRDFAFEQIINPKECSPHHVQVEVNSKIKKTYKETKKTANCVRILQDNNEIARGRVIAENSERIFLYIKEIRVNGKQENEVIRVPKSFPIHNAVIERVDTEDVILQ